MKRVVFAIATSALVACGAEDVDLDEALGHADAGKPEACVPVTTCGVIGATCQEDPECCSLHCDNKVCVPEEGCRPTNETCGSSDDCCSGVCDGTNHCAQTCEP